MKGLHPPPLIPPPEPPIPPPAPPIPPLAPPQLGPQCIPPPPPPIPPPLASTTPPRLSATAAGRLQEKQTGHAAATEAAPKHFKVNAMIAGSPRIGEPFDPLGPSMIEAQINGRFETKPPLYIAAMARAAQATQRGRRTETTEASAPAFHNRRSTIISLMWTIALAGFRPLGQVWAQFMIVWQR